MIFISMALRDTNDWCIIKTNLLKIASGVINSLSGDVGAVEPLIT